MKLYQTKGTLDIDGVPTVRTQWTGTLSDASKNRVAFKKADMKKVDTDEVEVPTNKPGLLAFLNALEA